MRLLRGLSGRVLPCGCLVGVYETYSGGVVATIDAPGATCTQPGHRLHDAVDLSQLGVALHSTPRDQSTRP